ncbi:MAG: acetate/propionate family kinase [Roseiarcus sp.]
MTRAPWSEPAPPDPGMVVLTLNSGSSSLKFGMYRVGPATIDVMLSGEAESIGAAQGAFHARDARGPALPPELLVIPSQREAVARVAKLLDDLRMPAPGAIGHRIVHGGPKLRRHCLIDDEVIARIEAAAPFAPLHAPAALAVIGFARRHFPGVPEVACFDTAFHAAMPEAARALPIPRELRQEGIERYGFHGLSCESILRQLGDPPPERLVIAHLGNGASVTAVRGGKSVDTSMGLTPTGGVIMGTRTGDLDPGVLLYLMREKKFDAAALAELVDHRSGLRGISGVSGDMRRLREAASSAPDARLAIQMFCLSVRKEIAAMAAALEGVDAIVFTGGIGEHDAKARASICAGLTWTGLSLDEVRNRSAHNPINAAGSRVRALVLTTREDEQIARHAFALARGRDVAGAKGGRKAR